jgi:structural maintenance of chromosome 1
MGSNLFFYIVEIINFNTLKEKLTEELRDSMKRSRKESELNTVDSQIRGLETRLKYSKTDREKTVSIHLSIDTLGSYMGVLIM